MREARNSLTYRWARRNLKFTQNTKFHKWTPIKEKEQPYLITWKSSVGEIHYITIERYIKLLISEKEEIKE